MEHLEKFLIEMTKNLSLKEGLISWDAMNSYQSVQKSAEKYNSQGKDFKKEHVLLKGVDKLKVAEDGFTAEHKLEISNVMAVQIILLNALQDANFANKMPTAKDIFLSTFKEVLGIDKKSTSVDGEALERLVETKEKMLLALTYTMHPKIFHTDEAREFQKEITELLEVALKDRSKEASIRKEIEAKTQEFIKKLKNEDLTITPQEQITYPKENLTSRKSKDRMKARIDEVVKGWNEAVEELDIPEEVKERLRIGPEERKVVERMWGEAVDADGREKATALQLMATFFFRTNGFTEPYQGPEFDPRQNAEVHMNTVSALIQRNFMLSKGINRDGDHSFDGHRFWDVCVTFVDKINQREGNLPEDFISPYESIYQDLGKHRAEFLKELIESDISLVPEEIKAYTIAFTKVYQVEFKKFLEKHDLDENTSFEQLENEYRDDIHNLQLHFLEEIKNVEVPVEIDGEVRNVKFFLDENGLQFQPDNNLDIAKNFFKGVVWLDENKNKTQIPKEDKATLMDTFKRLVVMNHIIDDKEIGGDHVVNRHSIANFGTKEHFYETMLLFKEAGLIEVEKGLVTKVKVGIQPLLETGEDMRNAVGVWEELLKDPLILSYYKARGQADFMFGYSDGAKSVGNLASERTIHNTRKGLAELFKKHGIEVNFVEAEGPEEGKIVESVDFEGPGGNGDGSRGSYPLMEDRSRIAPIINKLKAVVDATLQGNQPVTWADTKRGILQIASAFRGIVLAREKALTMTPEQKERQKIIDAAIDSISQRSGEIFEEVVRRHSEVYEFLKNMPKNAFISSRKNVRNATAKMDYESLRAIGVQHNSHWAELIFHQVGLKVALEEFIEGGMEVPNEKGEMVSGKKALQVLMKDDFFSAFIEKAAVMMKDFDPNIAKSFGEKTKARNFANDVAEHNIGLSDLLDEIVHGQEDKLKQKYSQKSEPPLLKNLVTVAKMLTLSGELKPDKDLNPNIFKAMNNAMFVMSEGLSNRFRDTALGRAIGLKPKDGFEQFK